MTQDEIIEMAIQAHVDSKTWIDIYKDSTTAGEARQYLEAFAKLVAAKEREACAQICETLWTDPDNGMSTEEECYGDKCADTIRARGEA